MELHIEQGPLLEQRQISARRGDRDRRARQPQDQIEGEGGHAGAVLMPDRRDAFLAAAEIALAVESAARSTGAIDTVGTVGVCEVFPGAVNSIPSRVRMEIDVRDIDEARRDHVLNQIAEACDKTAVTRQVKVLSEFINADPPAQCAPALWTL